MNIYIILKLVHILASIIAVGFNLSYVVWLMKGKNQPSHLLFALQGIKLLDDWVANPSYILALLSGLGMCYVGNLAMFSITWIFYPLILFTLMGIVAFGFYTPTLSRQIKILQTEGAESRAYQQIDQKQTLLGMILFAFALAIVVIMILKPNW
ncbi:MAG: DUF2269 domain-containing protein [Microscillaceae bacterium]|jgi:uncharacterized membrane protein|nr:DUF2269 domain-containing protein [Microscillaceae bacterium]